ncbi:formate dehydrogenase accessory sulfurtransferase FdhD [Thalassotalea sp. M1531]|uniref:Sulfur carrier protein FdhD n=1 Tax=Thalassotalea algicola TaxID=2716224 RepID=A0A7Y0Q5X1_9GAMM|nr:formate dehydrogenase accessory sulfurtransferase FdhD [Thalassotalea algicola]NMP30561.1 formate dehydrogenase accessory sulfurtransferase FdhD [Thalassotalea algicola]
MNKQLAINPIVRSTLQINQQTAVSSLQSEKDLVAVEQPLQIMLTYYDTGVSCWVTKQLAVIMRTPGQDESLVVGYLFTQGIIEQLSDIADICLEELNNAEVSLTKDVAINWQEITRLFASHSGCGVCGQSQLKQLSVKHSSFKDATSWLTTEQILAMPTTLREQQEVFSQTGGLHGAAIWYNNTLRFCAEDIGRHNAVDKVIGQCLIEHNTRKGCVLVLSGRISFELVQKAVVAGITVIVAVGAPSDLAITTAKQFNQTIIGFVKSQQANVYSGEQRLIQSTGNGDEL